MTTDWVDWLENHSASWMAGDFASGFWGVVFAQVGSNLQEQWVLACRHHLLDDPESPDDILPIIAKDRRLDRYYLETAAEHRQRLIKAWDIYALSASETVINQQLKAAGFGPDQEIAYGDETVEYGDEDLAYGDLGTFIEFRPWELGPRGEAAPYWSQFWVVFNEGFHPVTGPPTPWGQFVWGDTGEWVWRPAGYSRDFSRTIRAIVKKWKPSRWVFRGFRFLFAGVIYGDPDIEYGDPTIMYGGAIDVPVPL
jgi:hypothetical protein